MNTNTNTDRKPFLSMFSGKSGNASYAFHVEANVTREPQFFMAQAAGTNGATKDKKSYLRMNVALGRNAFALLGKDAEDAHEETPFAEVIAFGRVAESLHENICIGSKIAFCGKVELNEYTKKDGTPAANVRILADNAVPLACKATVGGAPGKTVTKAVNSFTRKDGTSGENMLVTLLTGKVKDVDAVKQVNGQDVVSFSLETEMPALMMNAIVDGSYVKGQDYGNYKVVRCSVWGQRAARLKAVLTVGNTLVVTGTPKVSVYNEQSYVNLTIRELSVMRWANPIEAKAPTSADETAPAPTPASAPAPNNVDYGNDIGQDFEEFDEDDDELPF